MRTRLAALGLLCFAAALLATPPAAPPGGRERAQATLAALKPPAGMKLELFAHDPDIASPVAICLDEKGRVYAAEEYRFNQGTEENRSRPFFLEDDLHCDTLDDRLSMIRKYADKFEGGEAWFQKHSDRVKLLEDTDGDGRADVSRVFADGFNAPLDGLGAGVMAHNGDVWYTCIPNLWKLRDTNGDGVADTREAVHTGFGVNWAFLGHDLHGLAWGPDGRLYFSVGDRGFHVRTKEGALLHGPRTGGVFRCEPDGSNLEVVHRGLRNPQELAFDQFGNLFADDNNCDKGDHARLVHVVEGGESGWNMAYQTIAPPYMAGPWFAERLWHLPHAGQAAYIVPPVGPLGSGPSGFLFTSGISLPERYRDRFFMANYTGNGGIESFGVTPKGAGFEIADYHDFLKPIKPTDIDMGYDGKLYVSDFVDLLWNGGSAGGRVYTVSDPARLTDPAVVQMKKLFAEGFDKRPTAELVSLLGHGDQRVRQRAQFALAGRAEALPALVARATQAGPTVARIHAIWGVGQAGRKTPAAVAPLVPLLADPDAEVRAQAAKAIGEANFADAAGALLPLVGDGTARVRFFAVQALGRLKATAAIPKLVELAAATGEADPTLRHAVSYALFRIGGLDGVWAYRTHASAAVRMAVVLVARRAEDARVAELLTDTDPLVATEAARACHDRHLDATLPAQAAALTRAEAIAGPDGEPMQRRALSAHYRLGGLENARAVVAASLNPYLTEAVRLEALSALRDWAAPPPRDRVTGFWRPLPARSPEAAGAARAAVLPRTDDLLTRSSGKLLVEAVALLAALNVPVDEQAFARWSGDAARPVAQRVAALRLLAERNSDLFADASKRAIADAAPALRAAARTLAARRDPAGALALLAPVAEDDRADTFERQEAWAALAALPAETTRDLFARWEQKLRARSVPAELEVDVADALRPQPGQPQPRIDAFKALENELATRPFAKYAASLTGGSPERGRDLFVGHAAAQCIRCHQVDGVGGVAGPALTGVVGRHPERTREYLLESLLNPNAVIAPGYGTVRFTLDDDRTVAGTVVSEDTSTVVVKTPEGTSVTVRKADVTERVSAPSAMPTMDRLLTPREARDIVAYLATLR